MVRAYISRLAQMWIGNWGKENNDKQASISSFENIVDSLFYSFYCLL